MIFGRRVIDPNTLAQLDLPDHETAVLVPKALMNHLPKEPHGAADA